jgi:hypothetical protein
MGATLTATGRYGSIAFDGIFVTITRTMNGRVLTGSAEKRYHIRNITGVNYMPATLLTLGRIEFTVAGALERRGHRPGRSRTKAALKDENALTFLRKANKEFEALRNAIYAVQAEIL